MPSQHSLTSRTRRRSHLPPRDSSPVPQRASLIHCSFLPSLSHWAAAEPADAPTALKANRRRSLQFEPSTERLDGSTSRCSSFSSDEGDYQVMGQFAAEAAAGQGGQLAGQPSRGIVIPDALPALATRQRVSPSRLGGPSPPPPCPCEDPRCPYSIPAGEAAASRFELAASRFGVPAPRFEVAAPRFEVTGVALRDYVKQPSILRRSTTSLRSLSLPSHHKSPRGCVPPSTYGAQQYMRSTVPAGSTQQYLPRVKPPRSIVTCSLEAGNGTRGRGLTYSTNKFTSSTHSKSWCGASPPPPHPRPLRRLSVAQNLEETKRVLEEYDPRRSLPSVPLTRSPSRSLPGTPDGCGSGLLPLSSSTSKWSLVAEQTGVVGLNPKSDASIAVQELQAHDEFSLVAAAVRRRQLFLVTSHEDNDRGEHTSKQQWMMALAEKNPAAFYEEDAQNQEADFQREAQVARDLMDGVAADCHLLDAALVQIRVMQAQRPFFHVPRIPKERPTRCTLTGPQDDPEVVVKEPWALATSIFMDRTRHCEARDLIDNDRILEQQFHLDWSRVASKRNFRRFLCTDDDSTRASRSLPSDPGGGGGGGAVVQVDSEVDAVRDVLHHHWHLIRVAFIYYSLNSPSLDTVSLLAMQRKQWHAFTVDTNIMDAQVMTLADMNNIFAAANFVDPEQRGTLEAVANDDNALMRFEFLEILVRAAHSLYIKPRLMTDFPGAVQRLIQDYMQPHMPDEARVDPNTFRWERLYVEAMQYEIAPRWNLLQAIYRLYKARDKTKYFTVEHWVKLLTSLNLIGPHTGLAKVEVKLVFVRSALCVVDELRHRVRATSLQLWDFVEAMARLADTLNLPPVQEIRHAMYTHAALSGLVLTVTEETTRGEVLWQYMQCCTEAGKPLLPHGLDRRQCGPNRLLADVFGEFVDMLVVVLCKIWGGDGEAQLLVRLERTAVLLSGGIEKA